jgi:hypothetical protein
MTRADCIQEKEVVRADCIQEKEMIRLRFPVFCLDMHAVKKAVNRGSQDDADIGDKNHAAE